MNLSAADLEYRVQVSLRLKAGRWLAGGLERRDRPNAKPKAAALGVSALAEHPVLMENSITRNRLEEIEQLKTRARPMELEKIAGALGQPPDWFAR